MYKLIKDEMSGTICSVFKQNENKCIPFDPDNTDYQTFKKDLANGVALSDAEGTAMTADQIKTFLETLP
jgi:hypothetical protein